MMQKIDQFLLPYELARITVENYISSHTVIKAPSVLKDVPEKRAGTFVSIKTNGGDLRGCIGTILPVCGSVGEEIVQNAISAATKDYRFPPISLGELAYLTYSVDILSTPEKIQDVRELDPNVYGVIVSARDGRRGLLLPSLEGVDTVDQQVSIALQKGNISPSETVDLMRFKVTRYPESLLC